MAKPKLPRSISRNHVIPEAISYELEFEPHILNGPIGKFCDPLEHVNAIPVKTLSELDLKHFYNNLIQGLYSLIKAKKRTAQEAELLGADITHTSIKRYKSEVLIEVSNARQRIESLENDDNYKDTDTMKEFRETRKMQEKNESLSKINNILDFLDGGLKCRIWSHLIHKVRKMNLKEDRLWKFVELRSADIPTNWKDRFNWVKMFELIATLFLWLKEEERVDIKMKKENSGLTAVPKEELLLLW
ncbi:hypothetical protein [Parasitella parasitica]|uniref:Uncharacterized protein n=1 Tax=Parasitella parasitica TaxID=35722 RepID=A0A0B7NVJ3_9FUNG|nr:hypothetical protein [Parasitella parasitica]